MVSGEDIPLERLPRGAEQQSPAAAPRPPATIMTSSSIMFTSDAIPMPSQYQVRRTGPWLPGCPAAPHRPPPPQRPCRRPSSRQWGGADRSAGNSDDLAAALEFEDARVVTVAIAAAEVGVGGVGELGPVGVVAALDDELGDDPDVALDPVEVTGVGRASAAAGAGGVLAAQVVKPQTRVLAEARGLRWVEVDVAEPRGASRR